MLPNSSNLANTPQNDPKYFVEVENGLGHKSKLADPKVTRALVALMNQHAVIGGAAAHWGGPAAFAEINSAIHGMMFKDKTTPWHETYNFVNDAGHAENGIYAIRANYGFDGLSFESLRGFRSIGSKLTGHGESHLNPEGVLISNGPLGSGLASAQGLAIADKINNKTRTTICTISDGAMMEGEAKEALASIPGLSAKGKLNPFLLVVSDNNTKLSGRIDKDCFSMSPSFEGLSKLGWEVVRLEDGHNLSMASSVLEYALSRLEQNPSKPVCMLVKTIKGYGIKATEESASGGHGHPLKPYDPKLPEFIDEIFGGSAPDEFKSWANEILKSKPEETKSEGPVKKKVQHGIANGLIRAKEEGAALFSLSADLAGSTGINAFQAKFPESFIDMGIAESNMIGTAIGLSKSGFVPVVDTFAQFAITKGNLPLIMSGLSEAPVIGLFSHTGFQDAADGASHQATTYFSAVSSIPNTTVISCSCSKEAEEYIYHGVKNFKSIEKSLLFFYGRETHPVEFNSSLNYEWGKAQVLREGDDVTIVTTGPLVQKALEASDLLKKSGISAEVINNVFVNEIDIDTFQKSLSKTKGHLVCLEDHQYIGGMSSQLVHTLVENGTPLKLKTLAIPGVFGRSAYKADHLYEKYNLDKNAVVKAVNELLGQSNS